MPKNKDLPISDEILLTLCRNGMSPTAIGLLYDCDTRVVADRLQTAISEEKRLNERASRIDADRQRAVDILMGMGMDRDSALRNLGLVRDVEKPAEKPVEKKAAPEPVRDVKAIAAKRVETARKSMSFRKRVVRRYRQIRNAALVGREFNISGQSVLNWAETLGKKTRDSPGFLASATDPVAETQPAPEPPKPNSQFSRRYSDDVILAAVEMYENNHRTREISEKFGADISTIRGWVKKLGGTTRPTGIHTACLQRREAIAALSETELSLKKHQVLEMYEAKNSARNVGKKFGVGADTVLAWVRELGGTVRPPGIKLCNLARREKEQPTVPKSLPPLSAVFDPEQNISFQQSKVPYDLVLAYPYSDLPDNMLIPSPFDDEEEAEARQQAREAMEKRFMDIVLTEEELRNGEFDGDPATGFAFGIYFYPWPDRGYVEACKVITDTEHNVSQLLWHPQLLKELLRRLNHKWDSPTKNDSETSTSDATNSEQH